MFPAGTRILDLTIERDLDDQFGDVATADGMTPHLGFGHALGTTSEGRRVWLRLPQHKDAAERLRGEAHLARQHKCDGLVGSLDVIHHDGMPIQLLAAHDGLSLAALMHAIGAIPAASVCRIGHRMATVLVELHERGGLAHGALSTGRVWLDPHGQVRLTDVGCAFVDNPVAFRSPERTDSDAGANTSDDIWALGAVLLLALAPNANGDVKTALADARDTQPQRLVDALAVLLAPLPARLKNAAAAVRIFSELEKQFGDGASILASLVKEQLAASPNRGPPTLPEPEVAALRDATGEESTLDIPQPQAMHSGVQTPQRQPFSTLVAGLASLPDASAPPNSPFAAETLPPSEPTETDARILQPVKREATNPATMELSPEAFLQLPDLMRMGRIAEEAARRAAQQKRMAEAETPLKVKALHEADTVHPAARTSHMERPNPTPRNAREPDGKKDQTPTPMSAPIDPVETPAVVSPVAEARVLGVRRSTWLSVTVGVVVACVVFFSVVWVLTRAPTP